MNKCPTCDRPMQNKQGLSRDQALFMGKLRALFDERGEQEEPIVYAEEEEWIMEYTLQMSSIMKDEVLTSREKMTALKNFETANKSALKTLPEETQKNLKDRRLAANKKLGAKK